VTAIINTKLLAIIPYIETQAEHNKKRKLIRTLTTMAVLILILLSTAAIIHFFVSPLDKLIASV
jgi:preprotein translocase subunit SecY